MNKRSGSAGFSLVEVAVAVAIAGFCLITLIALLPTGITSNRVGVEQTIATGLMAGVVADLRSTPTATSTSGTFSSPRYGIPILHAASTSTSTVTLFLKEDGSISGTLGSNADPTQNPMYRVMLNFYYPGSGYATSNYALAATSTAATRVRVLVTWPALADANATTVPINFTGSVETVIQLNRNWQDH